MLSLEEKNELLERVWSLTRERLSDDVLHIQRSLTVSLQDPELGYLFSLALFRQGRVEEAFDLSTRVAASSPASGAIFRKNLNLLGSLEVERGNLGSARSYFQQLVEDATSSGDHFHQAVATLNIGVIECIYCMWEEALLGFQHALTSFQCSGHRYNIAACHQNAGIAYREMGIYADADSHFEKAHEIVSTEYTQGDALYYIEAERALLLSEVGDLTHAELILRRCLSADPVRYSNRARGELLRALGVILGKYGKTDEAYSVLTEGLYHARHVRRKLLEAEIHEELALLTRKDSHQEDFAEHYLSIEEIYRSMGAYTRLRRFEARVSVS